MAVRLKNRTLQKIGLALSGGGVRATVFHLGLLDRLACESRLEEVRFLSTVSGGSLCVGLLLCHNNMRWPTSVEFRRQVEPRIRKILTGRNLQSALIGRVIARPSLLLRGRAGVLSAAMRRHWGISGDISDLPDDPRWFINATTYETGKNWRFSKKRMGDYLFNYVFSPRFPLEDALAASAAVPGLIGYLRIETPRWSWGRYVAGSTTETEPCEPVLPVAHLWDGGVYENLGLEALYKQDRGIRDGCDFLIVSDASRPLDITSRKSIIRPALRLVDIATDQVRSLRTRTMWEFFKNNPGCGAYLLMGDTVEQVCGKVGAPMPSRSRGECLGKSDVTKVKSFKTTLRQLDVEEYERIFRHGFEVADTSLHAYVPQEFGSLSYLTR